MLAIVLMIVMIIIHVTVSHMRMEIYYAALLGIEESPINKNTYRD